MNDEVAEMQLYIMGACWACADGMADVVSRCCRLVIGLGIVHECDQVAALNIRRQPVLREAVRASRIGARMLAENKGIVAGGFNRDGGLASLSVAAVAKLK
jgi:hypothetical protein